MPISSALTCDDLVSGWPVFFRGILIRSFRCMASLFSRIVNLLATDGGAFSKQMQAKMPTSFKLSVLLSL